MPQRYNLFPKPARHLHENVPHDYREIEKENNKYNNDKGLCYFSPKRFNALIAFSLSCSAAFLYHLTASI